MKTRLAIADTASKEARDLFEEIISELRCQVNKDQDQLYDERSKHYQVLSDTNSARRHVADMHARECRSKDMLAQTLQHEVDEHGMRLKDAQTDIDLMKSDVRRLQTEYLSLKASCNEKDKQLDAANSSLQQSHKDFAELQKENSAIRLVRQQLNDQIFALHGEIETVTASNKDLKRTKDEHITQIDHQKRDADLLRSANESLEKKFDDVESQVRVHEQEQKSHKETISKLQQDFHTLSHDIGTFQNPASKEHETMKELHNFKDDCENLESARLDLLAFLYSRLGFKAPENTCAAFEEDHTAPGGLSVQTKERIKECSAVLDLKEHIQANNTVNLESAYRTMALLTERVNDLHKQLIAPIECGCAADIQTLLTRNEELEKDVDDLMASLQEALNKHEAITTDLASNLDYVNGELKTVTSAYDELVAYVDGKVKAGKVT
jgi:chromosome segregation ATPase